MIESLVRLAALFVIAAGTQHLLMRIASVNHARLSRIPLLGNLFGVPAVFLHEVFGHLIPAVLSGSRVRGVLLGASEGHVSVSFDKNIFGFVSVLVMGFGPGLALPLLFLAIALVAGGYQPLAFALNENFVGKFAVLMADIFRLDSPLDFLLVYLMAITVPGAAASTGDIASMLSFARSAPVFTLVCIAFIAFAFVVSGGFGVTLADYGSLLVLNSFATFMCIYLPGLAIITLLVQGWVRRAYALAGIAMLVSLAMLYLVLPPQLQWAKVPASLLVGCFAVFLKRVDIDRVHILGA
ncbi:MAG: hypothetical protein QXU54_00595 [Candidatus Micrarchaeia archaeon]